MTKATPSDPESDFGLLVMLLPHLNGSIINDYNLFPLPVTVLGGC